MNMVKAKTLTKAIKTKPPTKTALARLATEWLCHR
jgi:hypothetical protein